MTAMLDYNEMVASMVILANIRRHLECVESSEIPPLYSYLQSQFVFNRYRIYCRV